MRKINMIVVHCTATRCNQNYTVEQLYHDHVEVNHWRFIGYHFYIRRDGTVIATRPLERMGAMPEATMPIPLASAMRAAWMLRAILRILARQPRSSRCRISSCA